MAREKGAVVDEKFYQIRARAIGRREGIPAQFIWAGDQPSTAILPPSHEQIRAWLGNKLPNHDKCVDRLHAVLGDMCTSVPAAKAIPYDPGEKVRKAMQVLQDQLPILIHLAAQSGKRRAAQFVFSELLVRTEIAEKFIQAQPRRVRHTDWHDDALVLLSILEDEADAPIHVSAADEDYAGPGCRFLLHALRHVWPDARIKPGTVKKAIHEARKRQW